MKKEQWSRSTHNFSLIYKFIWDTTLSLAINLLLAEGQCMFHEVFLYSFIRVGNGSLAMFNVKSLLIY